MGLVRKYDPLAKRLKILDNILEIPFNGRKRYMPLDSSQTTHDLSNPKTTPEQGCFVYTRVSTDRQAEEGYSLDEQEKSCKELAQRIGYKVFGVYREEGVSGTSVNRPKFQEMLGKCSDDKGSTVKAVIVIHTDRFARNTLEHLMIKGILLKSNVKLISVLQPMLDDSPEGNLLDIILAGMNEFYSKDLGRKTARALVQKAEEGWWPGFAPLGYVNKTNPETKYKIVVIDEERCSYIKEAFRRFATGKYTTKSLNDELFQEGFRSRTGKKLHKSRMAAMLRNIFYVGKLKIKDKIYNGKHEPLTDMSTFLKVQEVLDLHNRMSNRSRKHHFLLSGFLICRECNSQLIGQKHIKKSGLIYDYYRCMGLKHDISNCRQPFVKASAIEDAIVKLLGNITLSPEYVAALKLALERICKTQNQSNYSEIKTLQNRKMAILRKMDKLEDLLLEEIMDKKRIVEKYSKLKDDLTGIENQIELNSKTKQKLEKEDINKILSFVKSFDKTYVSINTAKKKKLFLKLLISKIFVKDKKIVEVNYTPLMQMIVDRDLVRVGCNWLPWRDLIRTIEELRKGRPIDLNRISDRSYSPL